MRPAPSRPAVVVRHSPAREEAHDPTSWFPVSELEALFAPERLVPEATPMAVTPVVHEPGPAPASVPEPEQTRAEIQRARRARRIRTRARLVVAGLGLGAGLLLARAHLTGAGSEDVVADVRPADAEAGSAAAGAATPPEDAAQPIEPFGFEVVPTSAVIPPPPPPPPPPLPNEEIWERMARCETGGNWQHHGPTWSGGLGIYRGTWLEAGGTEFAALPRDATREEQILVAERIRERHGWTAWGCARAIGMG